MYRVSRAYPLVALGEKEAVWWVKAVGWLLPGEQEQGSVGSEYWGVGSRAEPQAVCTSGSVSMAPGSCCLLQLRSWAAARDRHGDGSLVRCRTVPRPPLCNHVYFSVLSF